ncbi:hypothetical protein FRC11_009728 [Ceratobasidium sp. 423]|nr:hypothetical protein FRC11_009728 [Ceratobasidium sp. 423]
MSRLPEVYRAVHAFLSEQGHTKAALAVKKAALPVVDVESGPAVAPGSLVDLFSRQVPVADVNSRESADHSSSSDDSSSSGDDEPVASPAKAPSINGKKVGATNTDSKVLAKASDSSDNSSSSEDESSDSDEDSSDSDSDSSSDEEEEKREKIANPPAKPIADSKAIPVANGLAKPTVNGKSKAKESDSSGDSSNSSSSDDSDSSSSSSEDSSSSESSSSESESESESEAENQPAAKKRKVDATSSVPVPAATTTKSETTTVATTAESVTLTKSTTTSTTTSTNGENGKQKGPRKPIVPFSRIKTDEVIYADPRLMNNSFDSKGGTVNDYGERASRDLIVTRGAGFRKEKNKKKRGSYRGGEITLSLGWSHAAWELEDGGVASTNTQQKWSRSSHLPAHPTQGS